MKPRVGIFYGSLAEISNRHRSGSSSLKDNLNDINITKVKRSVTKEAEERLKLAEHRLKRDHDSRAADDDSDAGSKINRVKVTQTELSAHSANSFYYKDAMHELNYHHPVICSQYKLFLNCSNF